MQDPCSPRDRMQDVGEITPLDNPLQALWWGKYGDQACHLAVCLWERAHGEDFHAIPAGTTPQMYALYAMAHGTGLLLGSETAGDSAEEVEVVQRTFLETEGRELRLIELLGFVI